jgi:hypothetical protein
VALIGITSIIEYPTMICVLAILSFWENPGVKNGTWKIRGYCSS